jgi:hypothetical protein
MLVRVPEKCRTLVTVMNSTSTLVDRGVLFVDTATLSIGCKVLVHLYRVVVLVGDCSCFSVGYVFLMHTTHCILHAV